MKENACQTASLNQTYTCSGTKTDPGLRRLNAHNAWKRQTRPVGHSGAGAKFSGGSPVLIGGHPSPQSTRAPRAAVAHLAPSLWHARAGGELPTADPERLPLVCDAM